MRGMNPYEPPIDRKPNKPRKRDRGDEVIGWGVIAFAVISFAIWVASVMARL